MKFAWRLPPHKTMGGYRVKSSKGAIVRRGRALETPVVETLACGAAVDVSATRSTLLGECRCRLASGGWCSLKVLEAVADGEEPRAAGAPPEGAGAAVAGAHGECQVDDCAAFRGLAVSGGWDGVVRVADGARVETLAHSNNAWVYSVAPFLDGGGGLAIMSGHTGGMMGDSGGMLSVR